MRTKMTERPVIAVLILAAGLVSVAVATMSAYPRLGEPRASSLPHVVTGLSVEASLTTRTAEARPASIASREPTVATPQRPRTAPAPVSSRRLLTYGDMYEMEGARAGDESRKTRREVVLPPVREERSDGKVSGSDPNESDDETKQREESSEEDR